MEGGYNEGGKSASIWDTWAGHNGEPSHIAEGADAKVACDSYHKYADDVALLKGMGLSHYRFSIAWTRILPDGTTGTLPDGTTGTVNEAGVQYYKNLIAALKAEGIEPVVTLYHWDLPQVLSDQGGLLNPQFADWFVEYARVCFREFGDDVSGKVGQCSFSYRVFDRSSNGSHSTSPGSSHFWAMGTAVSLQASLAAGPIPTPPLTI